MSDLLERIFHGSKLYWAWMALLLLVVCIGIAAYVNQFVNGLELTGMSQDVSWGLYIAQFAFFVGVAASGVMVAIPLYLHNFKVFGKVVILGEFMAVAAVLVALLFVIVDLGYPTRVFNVILFPTPNSILFWDMVVLSSYLIVNILIGWAAIGAERKGIEPAKWVHVLALVAIPLAVSIHTVTAFIFAGMPGKAYWLTAILAARFLASAFAAGPALLIIICLIMRKLTTFKVADRAIDALAKIVCYAIIANVFFFLLEVYTAFYSNIPGHMAALEYLFVGLEGSSSLVPFMWAAAVLAFLGILFLVVPKLRKNRKTLVVALVAVFLACWLDKGLGLVLGGFVPNSFGQVVEYAPALNEVLVILGVYAIGLLVLTALFKIVVDVRASVDQGTPAPEQNPRIEAPGA
ncbi:sulfate reduction electron transfer complex DsrMKJOP subunit DsrP [Gordonibacter sp.]|uniref:sulfate reduction electron transfer complex DsrMKJOP subunit DsrP n=1 Tax=Gordonibacter sp. TaxID=1968902 RepID=UPI002FC763EC